MMSGKQTPTPVSAADPISGIWPIYMRSTMLYSALTTCEVMEGRARISSRWPIGSLPKSTSFDIFSFICILRSEVADDALYGVFHLRDVGFWYVSQQFPVHFGSGLFQPRGQRSA